MSLLYGRQRQVGNVLPRRLLASSFSYAQRSDRRLFPQNSEMFGKVARAPPTAILQNTARTPRTVSHRIMILTGSVDLKNTYPLIVTPSHDGKFFQNYVLSLLNFVAQSQTEGLRLQMLLHQGESLISRARNNCVAKFLANKEWTHLFWIDSDIGFSSQAAFRLLQSGYDMAAGVYPLKRENWPVEGVPAGTTRYTVNTVPVNNETTLRLEIQVDGFIQLDEAPTGFMVVKRCVFEHMMLAYPDLQYTPDSINDQDVSLHYRFFDAMVDPKTRRYLSEDYGFCRRRTGLGKSVYVDAHSNLTHQGVKLYRSDFATSLQIALPTAIDAPIGTVMSLRGSQFLRSNQAGPS